MFWAIRKKIFSGHLDKRVFISYFCRMKYDQFFRNDENRVRHLADSSVLKRDFARAHSDVV